MDITPMIDITFLLLIFFLVTSIPDEKTSVTLPEATHGDAVSQLDAVVFTVAQGGDELAPVYAADGRIEGKALTDDPAGRDEAIQEAVKAGIAEGKTDVVVKADRGVAYRHVASVIDSVSRVEGASLHIAVLDSE